MGAPKDPEKLDDWIKEIKGEFSHGERMRGVGSEFQRYVTTRTGKAPTDEDVTESLRMGLDVRCEACVVILKGLLSKAKTYSEDNVIEQLDGELGDLPDDPNIEPQLYHVMKHKVGCNKHFKDE